MAQRIEWYFGDAGIRAHQATLALSFCLLGKKLDKVSLDQAVVLFGRKCV